MTGACRTVLLLNVILGFFLVGVGLSTSTAYAAIPAAERQALIDLYVSTSGADWVNRDGWWNAAGTDFGDPGTECSWFGVTCSDDGSSVTEVVLNSNRLEGSIPASLSDLGNLEQLVLYSNDIGGPIPPSLGSLINLTNLDLDFNRLTGPIPSEFGGLANLRSLWLDHNHLEGEIPISLGSLAQLEILALNNNRLEGEIPSELTLLTTLQSLNLASNRFVGTIPTSITAMSMVSIGLDWNALGSDDPLVLEFLEAHFAGNWKDTQTVPPGGVTINETTRASALLSWTPGTIPDRPGGYDVLFSATPGGPFVVGATVEGRTASSARIVGLTPGTSYWFSVRSFTSAHGRNENTVASEGSPAVTASTTSSPGSEIFAKDCATTEGTAQPGVTTCSVILAPASLNTVTIDWETIDGSAVGGIDFVPGSGALVFAPGETTTTIEVTTIVDSDPEPAETFSILISNPTNATVIRAEATGMIIDDDPIPAERQALIDLYNSTTQYRRWRRNDNWRDASGTEFNEPGTECSWWGVTCVPGRVAIAEIYLPSNDLFGRVPLSIGDLDHLRYLSLNQNWNVLGPLPTEIGNLTSLEELDLSYNALGVLSNGGIPASFGGLTNLRVLLLIQDGLSGEIPSELGNLSELRSLWLSVNELTGTIPASFANLTKLEWLALSSNQLEGSIPSWIGGLSALEILHLGWNHFDGNIPTELGNLVSLEQISLASNKLSGQIPGGFANLNALKEGLSYVRWNAIHSDDPAVVAVLDDAQSGGDWQSTQTIPPTGLVSTQSGDHTVWLQWESVDYSVDPGGYEVFVSPAGAGAWASAGQSQSKTATSIAVANLDSGVAYDFAVATFTSSHSRNSNLVVSDRSDPVLSTTTDTGCAAPEILIDWGPPIALSVATSHDGYLWSTGETSSSIELDIGAPQSYWVVVTGPGACEEADDIFVDVPSEIDLGSVFVAGSASVAAGDTVSLTNEYSNHSGRTPDEAYVQITFLDGAFSIADAAWYDSLAFEDSRGNVPLFFQDQVCDLVVQLRVSNPGGIDLPGGTSGRLLLNFTMPMSPLGIGGLQVVSPAELAGGLLSGKTTCADCPTLETCFGPRLWQVDPPVTAPFVVVDDGVGEAADGCEPITNDIAESIALIRRGTCEFGVKALNAENAGARAVVIMNNRVQEVTSVKMGPGAVGASVTIPVVLIDQTDGDLLEASFLAGEAPAGAIGALNPGMFTLKSSIFHNDGTVDPNLSNNIDWFLVSYPFFADSFETGDTSAWSSIVGRSR